MTKASEIVLVVDDNYELRSLVRELLEFNGYRVLDASDGREARVICERYIGPIHLLLTDMEMPGLSGPEVARQIHVLRPDIEVLFMSAEPRESLVRRGRLPAEAFFLQKPFRSEGLWQTVRMVLQASQAKCGKDKE